MNIEEMVESLKCSCGGSLSRDYDAEKEHACLMFHYFCTNGCTLSINHQYY